MAYSKDAMEHTEKYGGHTTENNTMRQIKPATILLAGQMWSKLQMLKFKEEKEWLWIK